MIQADQLLTDLLAIVCDGESENRKAATVRHIRIQLLTKHATDQHTIDSALKHLHKNGYITDDTRDLPTISADEYISKDEPDGKIWTATFDGIVFNQSGGYVNLSEKEKSQKKIRNLKEILLMGGAWMASLTGAGLLYFEYVKLNHHNPYGLTFWQILVGVAILVIPITLLIVKAKPMSNTERTK